MYLVCRLLPPTHPSTLSLHDALPISSRAARPSGDLPARPEGDAAAAARLRPQVRGADRVSAAQGPARVQPDHAGREARARAQQFWRHLDRKSTRLNSSHRCISYAVFCPPPTPPLFPYTTLFRSRHALLDHLVIFLRDQKATPLQQLAFARKFGEPIEYPQLRGLPESNLITPVVKLEHERNNFGGI